jgi:DHA1 family tetracycline resistance protein-like MFS transporter
MLNKKKALLAIILIIFIDMLGIGILITIIPQLFGDPMSVDYLLNGSMSVEQGYLLMGMLTAIYPLMMFFSAPILGQFSDKIGRRKILMISLVGTAFGYILFALGILWKNIPLLFVARAIDGLTAGNIAVAQAALADITAPEDRSKNFGLIGAMFGLGFIIGPFLGGKLSDPQVVGWFNSTVPFYFAALLSLFNVLLVWKNLPETLAEPADHLKIRFSQSILNIKKAILDKELRWLFLTNFLYQGGFNFFTTFFAIFAITKFGFSRGDIGNYFAYVGIWIAFSQAVITRKVAAKFKEVAVLKVSLIMTGLLIYVHLLPNQIWPLYVIVPFFAIFNGLSHANMMGLTSRSASSKIQGEVMGISSGVQALAQTIPPIISGWVAATFSPTTSILVAADVVVFSGLVFLTWQNFKKGAKAKV